METVISVPECMEICGNDSEFMNEMIILTREDMIECINIVSKTFSDNDIIGLRNVAHRIKGTAATIAATPLRDASKRVEDSSKKGYLTKLEYLRLIIKIQEFIRNTSNV